MGASFGEQSLSVTEIAVLCGVGRSTVGLLDSVRKASGRSFGPGLCRFRPGSSPFSERLRPARSGPSPRGRCRTVLLSSRFVSAGRRGPKRTVQSACTGCMVYKKRLRACFGGRCHVAVPGREIHCSKCTYYLEHVTPRIAFIHQLATPAMVYEDLYIWWRQCTLFRMVRHSGACPARAGHGEADPSGIPGNRDLEHQTPGPWKRQCPRPV